MRNGRRIKKRERSRSARAARQTTARWVAVGTVAAYTALGSARVSLAATETTLAKITEVAPSALSLKSFDVPPGPLVGALAAYEAVSGWKVTGDPETLRALTSPGVRGLYTEEEALRALLAGTGLVHRLVGPATASLEIPRASAAVEVQGTIPPSSPKYTEPLRDIPQSITIVPKGLIESQGATTLRDVLRNVPAITIQAGEGGVPAGDNLTIRGFSARTDMFVDGVRDFGGYTRDTFNLEQVEVTKGPASVVAGRGSTGGSVNLVSKLPTQVATRTAALGVGTDGYARPTVDVNEPIGKGTSLRVNAMWQSADTPGRNAVEGERWGFAPSLAFGLDGATQVTLSYVHLDQDNLPDYGIPWVPANTGPLAEYSGEQPPVAQSNFYGLRERDYELTKTDIGTALFRHQFDEVWTLRDQLRYGRNRRDSVITAPRFANVNSETDYTRINRNLQSRDMTDTIFANQTDLTGRLGGGRHTLVAGVEVVRETSENLARSGPAAPQADLFSPNPSDPYPGPITHTGAKTDATADSFAVYAFDTFAISEKWDLTGGLRYDRFDAATESTAADGAVTPLGRVDDMVSWRAGAVYKPRADGSIYAAAGTSFNPSAEGLALSAATVLLEPEESRTFEVGMKWDFFSGRLSANAAIFRTEKTNARTPGVDPGDPPTVLQGKQRVDGIELGASGQLAPGWSAFAGLALLSSEILESNIPAEVGNEMPLTPDTTWNLWTTYQFPWRLTVGGGVQYMGEVQRNALNNATAPSYTLLEALAEYRFNDLLTLRVNGYNLTDEEYVDRIGGGHYIPGAGRSATLTAIFGF
jgi:catecholate siderophore receptor